MSQTRFVGDMNNQEAAAQVEEAIAWVRKHHETIGRSEAVAILLHYAAIDVELTKQGTGNMGDYMEGYMESIKEAE